MTHEPECNRTMSVDANGDMAWEVFGPCICPEILRAWSRGYNDHARTVQHWQDTHGAYRQHGEGENP